MKTNALLALAGFACVAMQAGSLTARQRTLTGHAAEPAHAQAPADGGSDAITRFEFKRVNFHVDETIVLQIGWLRGELLPAKNGVPPTFDDRETLLMQIEAGEAAMSTASFTDLMNRYVFHYPGAPLTNIRVSTVENGRIRQEAILHKGVDLPTEMVGTLDALPDGRIRFHPESIKAGGIPAKSIMDATGLQVGKLVQNTAPRGVSVVGDDLILDLERMLPPPQVRLRVTAVRVERDRIVQVFGPKTPGETPKPLTPLDPNAANYMYFRGGTIRFKKLTMADADMQMVDAQPESPFDFSLSHYYEQLVAGYTRTTLSGALINFVPDYRQLRDRSSLPAPGPAPLEGVKK